jgi:choline dehydrogenase-like flavoprotein
VFSCASIYRLLDELAKEFEVSQNFSSGSAADILRQLHSQSDDSSHCLPNALYWETELVQPNFLSWTKRNGTAHRIQCRQVLHETSLSQPGRLTIVSASRVDRVIFTDQDKGDLRAVGVLVRDSVTDKAAQFHTTGAGEVILCAGAIESPRILFDSMKSSTNADVIAVVDELGKHLQDHVLLPMIFLNVQALLKAVYNAVAAVVNSITAVTGSSFKITLLELGRTNFVLI